MFAARRKALADDRGFLTVLGLGIMSIIMVFAIGVTMVNYQSQSTLSAQTKNMMAAIESRANTYAAAMNVSMSDDIAAPSLAYEYDARTFLSTTITAVTAEPDGRKNLVIHSQTENGRYAIDRVVTIAPTKVSHITGYDEAGYPVWALAAGASPYTLWGFAAGDVRPLTLTEENGQATNASEWRLTSNHLGIDNAGKLWAWGANGSGQVGNGTTATATQPVAITPSSTYRSIVSDDNASFAIDKQGTLWAWGSNANNKLGLDSSKNAPTRTSFGAAIQMVATGNDQGYAIDSRGRLFGWGYNAGSRVGSGSSLGTLQAPEQISPGQTFRYVTTDGGSTFAIDTGGQLWAWGENSNGQLGLGSGSGTVTVPRLVLSGTGFAAVDTSGLATAAITTAGTLYAWGDEFRSGNGSGARTMWPSAVNVSGTFTSVAVNSTTSYATNAAGQIYAWGINSAGQYGDGTTTYDGSPRAVLVGTNFVSIFAGNVTSAVDSRGGLWTFGRGGAGLWSIDFAGAANTALKMPFPSGFAPSGWK